MRQDNSHHRNSYQVHGRPTMFCQRLLLPLSTSGTYKRHLALQVTPAKMGRSTVVSESTAAASYASQGLNAQPESQHSDSTPMLVLLLLALLLLLLALLLLLIALPTEGERSGPVRQ
jgi:hypothetical protein